MNAHEIFLNKQIRILLLTVQVATVANIYFEYWRFIWRYALFTTCCFERIFAMCVKWSWKRCAQFPSAFLLLHFITKWQNCCKNWKHSKLHMRHSSGSVLLVCPFQFAMFSASQTVCKVLPLEMFDPRDEKVGGTYLALLMLASCPH